MKRLSIQQLERAFGSASFNGEFLSAARGLGRRFARRRPQSTTADLRARSLVAESLDYLGNAAAARAVVGPAHEGVPPAKGAPFADADLELLRERVRLEANYARVIYYRAHEYPQAREILAQCLEVVEQRMRREARPFYGLRGMIHYYLGCTYRQLARYDEAEQSYGSAIELSTANAETYSQRYRQPDGVERARESARWKTAISLGLGLGWVNYTRGFLSKALHGNILPAEVLLIGTSDDVNRAYIRVIKASIRRSLTGTKADGLRVARGEAEQAYRALGRHSLYRVRAAVEIALCYLYSNDLARSLEWIDRVSRNAAGLKDSVWSANALLLRSRLRRRQGASDDAIRHADAAFDLADTTSDPIAPIEARICRAEAAIDARHYDLALSSLAEASQYLAVSVAGQRIAPNPKLAGVIALHRSRACIRANRPSDAIQAFSAWQQLRPLVEHRMVLEMAGDIALEIESGRRGFAIAHDEPDLTYEQHEVALRRWLMQQARAQGQGRSSVAKRLGISEVTLRTWETNPKPRAGVKRDPYVKRLDLDAPGGAPRLGLSSLSGDGDETG